MAQCRNRACPPTTANEPTGLRLFVEICGGIASGKTTLAELLTNAGIVALYEDFQANPFWEAFYADPSGNAFETEVSFLLQHYHQVKTARDSIPFACDFSFFLDAAYAHVTLEDRKRAAFDAVYREIRRELPVADLTIHLACDAAIELERIQRRGRQAEQGVSIDYLDAIDRSLQQVLREEGRTETILVIDSGTLNFAPGGCDRYSVLELVRSRIFGNIPR